MRPTLADTALARENLMLDRLSAAVNAFYEDPQNMQAYLAWRQNKMKITVTMELTQENLSKLRALLPNTEIPGQVSMFDSPSEKPVEPTAEAPKTEDKPITKTDIRAVALKLSKAGKQKELVDIFAKFGCKKLSDFDSRTEDYPALMKELVSVNG
jgi:hypothetical protein